MDHSVIREEVRGLNNGAARRVGMMRWLERARVGQVDLPGDFWVSGRFIVSVCVNVLMLLTGAGVMTGMLDRERMAFHLLLVMGVCIGLPLLFLVVTVIGLLWRRGVPKKLGIIPRFFASLMTKLDAGNLAWWKLLKLEGGGAWKALGWNLVRLTQAAAFFFALGLMVGLLGCIWFFDVGFYWESTTPAWVAERILELTGFLSSPWSWYWAGGMVDAQTVAVTRWIPNMGVIRTPEVVAVWYEFFLAAIFCWVVIPRSVLWGYSFLMQRAALARIEFQSKRHRVLWRELLGTRRADVSEVPMDGVLVLDVGGTRLKQEDLRGFLLRRLRVNPSEWFEVGVWDEKGEEAALESIRKAPAGVVLLAEGWALSPARMKVLHRQIRELGGAEAMIFFLVLNVSAEELPGAVTDAEKTVWTDFVDGLADTSAEVFFYEGTDV